MTLFLRLWRGRAAAPLPFQNQENQAKRRWSIGAVHSPETRTKEILTMPRKYTTDALKILAHIIGNDPKRQQQYEEELANREVASRIYQLREEAGLSQAELARRVGTTQSVISRLEDADYEGHSLAMLNRIAAAVERRVEIRFVPRKRRLQPA